MNKFTTKANEFKLLGVPWLDLPHFHERDRRHLSIRRLWWCETDYNRRPPSPEFMARLPQLLADAQREVENDKRERVAAAAVARELLHQARKPPCEQCLRPASSPCTERCLQSMLRPDDPRSNHAIALAKDREREVRGT